MMDDSSYLPAMELSWDFRFKGDYGTGVGDDFEGIWPEEDAKRAGPGNLNKTISGISA
jgi:hypothetical protein